jgi:replicative DNA helicase
VSASPGSGKTTFALGLSHRYTRDGYPVLYASLELSRFEAMSRLVSMLRGKPWSKVRRGAYPSTARAAMNEVTAQPFYLADQSEVSGVEDLVGQARRIKRRHAVAPLVVIDHVQLLADLENIADLRRGADLVATGVLQLATEHGCPVLLLSSVARTSYNVPPTDRARILAMAKESGRFESDAAVVTAILIADSSNARDQRGWIVVAKNRLAGQVGHVPISFDGLRGTFQEVSPSDVPSCTNARRNPGGSEKLAALLQIERERHVL